MFRKSFDGSAIVTPVKVLDRLGSVPWPVALALAGALGLAEVTVIAVLTTHDRGTAPPAIPRVVEASLVDAAGGSRLGVAAQAADGTVVRVEARWPDGHEDVRAGGCRADGRSYGGEVARETIDHPHRSARADVRVFSRQCVMPGRPLRVSGWKTVFVADDRQ